MNGQHSYLADDWYGGGIAGNVAVAADVYIDTSYSLAPFLSRQDPGLALREAAGAYDRSAFVVGPQGRVTVGPYTCLNACYLICNERIDIGAHCLIAWGVVITDTWLPAGASLAARGRALQAAAAHPDRWLPPVSAPRPVTLEDAVWVGFDTVILPGVKLGRGCVVGAKSVIGEDVPPYAVVAGNPPRVIRYLEPDDSEAARRQALKEYRRG